MRNLSHSRTAPPLARSAPSRIARRAHRSGARAQLRKPDFMQICNPRSDLTMLSLAFLRVADAALQPRRAHQTDGPTSPQRARTRSLSLVLLRCAVPARGSRGVARSVSCARCVCLPFTTSPMFTLRSLLDTAPYLHAFCCALCTHPSRPAEEHNSRSLVLPVPCNPASTSFPHLASSSLRLYSSQPSPYPPLSCICATFFHRGETHRPLRIPAHPPPNRNFNPP